MKERRQTMLGDSWQSGGPSCLQIHSATSGPWHHWVAQTGNNQHPHLHLPSYYSQELYQILTVLLPGYTTWNLPFPSLQACPLLSPSSPTLPSRFPAVLMFHRSPFQISIEAASRKLRSDGCTSPTKNHGQLQYILQTTREEKGQCKKYTNGTNSEGPRTKNKKKKTKQNNKTYSEIPITFPLSWRMSKKEEIWRK